MKPIELGSTVEITQTGRLKGLAGIVTGWSNDKKWGVTIPGMVGEVTLATKFLRVIG